MVEPNLAKINVARSIRVTYLLLKLFELNWIWTNVDILSMDLQSIPFNHSGINSWKELYYKLEGIWTPDNYGS